MPARLPGGVGLRQGRQEKSLLDLEVPAPAGLPERLQMGHRAIKIRGAGATQPQRCLQCVVVVARQRREGRRAPHS
jgi:hypothetical protein